ncbi:hypothetical protein BB560_006134, partial [Smittium megazygosporum]
LTKPNLITMVKYKRIYYFLLLVRFLAIFLPGYIHPDQFFQGPEVSAGDLLSIPVIRTWEFDPDLPCRSILPIFLTSGVPILIFKLLSGLELKNIFSVYLLHFNLGFDYRAIINFSKNLSLLIIIIFANKPEAHKYKVLCLLSISYPMLTFMTSTFSNSFETVILVLIFACLSYIEYVHNYILSLNGLLCEKVQQNIQNAQDKDFQASDQPQFPANVQTSLPPLEMDLIPLVFTFLGLLIGIGPFIRPTFIFYAASPLFVILFLAAKTFSCNWKYLFMLAVFFGVSLSLSILSCIIIDTLYFNKTNNILSLKEILLNPSITPYNNFLYNSNEANLKLHGIHPRYLHSLVNLPLLFGPSIFILYKLCYSLYFEGRNSNKDSATEKSPNKNKVSKKKLLSKDNNTCVSELVYLKFTAF